VTSNKIHNEELNFYIVHQINFSVNKSRKMGMET
jgi:hypothetical protein